MLHIDRNSRQPIYQQLYEQIKHDILTRNLPVGMKITTVPLIEKKIMARFIADGHWEKHVRKICLAHKRKHDALILAIKNNIGDRVQIYGHQAGLHILLEFLDGQQEEDLIHKALEYKVKVYPVSPFWLNKHNYRNNAQIHGYTGLSRA